ncbi:hypothetical protein [Rhabdaerophilum sp. SD176]|uniref:hypothetical protein n=1 Tax=Rhabdaerophilum sp. SD176 TaxID=2983548 RepID=UPI0024DFF630|nr:hypothetical protein [Rhabdaerophilum sp. SD176]
MGITETLPQWRAGITALALAALPVALPLPGATAATRTGTLEVSLTILGQCLIRTVPSFQAGDIERMVLTGETSGAVLVRCSQSTPFSLAWSRDSLRSSRPAIRPAPLGTAPFNPRLDDRLAQDSPLSLTNSPSRLIIPSIQPETPSGTMVPETPSAPPMMVITF